MIIKDIRLEYVSANGFCSADFDRVRHVKVLPYLSVVQAVEGHYDIALGSDAPLSTGCGGFFVAPADVVQTIVHNADPQSGRMTCRWVFLRVKLNGESDLDEVYQFPTVLPTSVREEMNAVFETLFSTDDTAAKYVAYYRIIQLLLAVGQEKEQPTPSYIARAAAFIREHAGEKIAVRDIAGAVNLSESRLFAVFKSRIGISPIAYLTNYRLSLAAEMLLDTDRTVTDIAAGVGIEDSVYFNKLFKKNYRMPPTEYRRRHRRDDDLRV